MAKDLKPSDATTELVRRMNWVGIADYYHRLWHLYLTKVQNFKVPTEYTNSCTCQNCQDIRQGWQHFQSQYPHSEIVEK